MSEQKHSPEPWISVENRDYSEILDDSGRWVATTHQRLRGSIARFTHTDAARIVACVNAMAGISDPAALVAAAREVVEQLDEHSHTCARWRGCGEPATRTCPHDAVTICPPCDCGYEAACRLAALLPEESQ